MLCVPEQGHMVLACGSSGFSHPLGSNFTTVDSYVPLPFLYIQIYTFACFFFFWCLCVGPALKPAADSTSFGEL